MDDLLSFTEHDPIYSPDPTDLSHLHLGGLQDDGIVHDHSWLCEDHSLGVSDWELPGYHPHEPDPFTPHAELGDDHSWQHEEVSLHSPEHQTNHIDNAWGDHGSSHHEISFGSNAGDANHDLQQAEYYDKCGRDEMHQAESYMKDGNLSKAQSLTSAAKDHFAKAESFKNAAKWAMK